MNKIDAKAEAVALVGPAMASLLSEESWERAAGRSLTFDEEGRVPGSAGYVDSYDAPWMAADAVGLLALQNSGKDITKRLVVNGDTIEVTPGNLAAMALGLRKLSPLWPLVRSRFADQFTEIRVPSVLADFRPTSGG